MLENSAVGTKFRIGGGGGRFPLRYGVGRPDRAERSGLKIFPVGGGGGGGGDLLKSYRGF